MNPENFIITKDTVIKLLNYLAVRPWNEANPLIAELQQLKPTGTAQEGWNRYFAQASSSDTEPVLLELAHWN